ncbi:MAG: hypothetical protein HQK65_20280 [Desulfamplus sp.]|nr:hypothetical protein [Desulfamplus sp.]
MRKNWIHPLLDRLTDRGIIKKSDHIVFLEYLNDIAFLAPLSEVEKIMSTMINFDWSEEKTIEFAWDVKREIFKREAGTEVIWGYMFFDKNLENQSEYSSEYRAVIRMLFALIADVCSRYARNEE